MDLWPRLAGVSFREYGPADHRTYKRKAIKLKSYEVVKDGQVVGYVWRRMATLEKKIPGKRYVEYRWEAPRWVASEAKPGHQTKRLIDCTSRQQAADMLMRGREMADLRTGD